jgi:hypothetical protein
MEDFSILLTLIATLFGIVGTVFGIIVVIRTRQLSRPNLRLHFGAFTIGDGVIREARHRQKRVVVYRLPQLGRDYYLVPFGIGIENRSSVPITSLELQLEFAADSLLDNSRLVDRQHGPFTFDQVTVPGRMANRFGERAQVKFEFDIIRSKQKIVVWEVVRIPRDRIAHKDQTPTQVALEEMWGGVPSFLSALEVRISAWAANTDPVAVTGLIAACHVQTEDELTETATALFARLWRGWAPQRGVRRHLRFWRQPWSVELAELIYLTKDALRPEKADIDPTILERAHHALLRFQLPRWGFSGEARAMRGIRKLSTE